jgi:anti-sigma regulatory factor (Ser/Thr protein kinase)
VTEPSERPPRIVELPATRAAPRLGREFIRSTLDDWGLAPLVDTATLLVSEVVTNAVVHANSGSTLCVERTPAAVRVTVTDRGDGVAERAAARRGMAGGHGLALLDTLARRWGARRVDGGHEVWFDLGVPSVGATTDSPS